MNKQFLHQRLSDLLAHEPATKSAQRGGYWHQISYRLLKQIETSRDDAFFSSSLSYAASFSGAPYNGVRDLAAAHDSRLFTRFARKTLNALARLKLDAGIARPLWRAALGPHAVNLALHEAAGNYNTFVHWGYELLKDQILSLDVSTPACYGPDVVMVDGRPLSYKTLRDLDILLRIKELVPAPPHTVVEIGAGIGELARLAVKTGYARRYIIVDIAPTLAFSQTLIAAAFPEAKISWFDPRRQAIGDGEAIFYFLTPDQISCIPPFDLGINVASFGEMTRDIVSAYVAALKTGGFRDFVSINQRLRKDHNPDGFGEMEYAAAFAPEFKIARRSSYRTNRPMMGFIPDEPGRQGYQLLHFVRT